MPECRVAAGSTGIFTGTGESYDIRQHTPALSRIIRRQHILQPVTQETRNRYRRDYIAMVELVDATLQPDSRWRIESNLKEARYPAHLPAFSELIIDAEGNLWVKEYLWPGMSQVRRMNSKHTDPAFLYRLFDSEPASIADFLSWLRVRYGIRSVPTVLDVGCGPGRLLPAMHQLGWRPIGMEPDNAYRSGALDSVGALGLEVWSGGFNDLEADSQFDMILGINGSFAHVLSPADRADALRRCRRSLRDGGVLVLDLPNLLRILHEYKVPPERVARTEEAVVRLTRRHTIDYAAATFTTYETYSIEELSGVSFKVEKEHQYAITTWPDLAYLLSQAGLGQIETFSTMADRDPGPPSEQRLVIAARAT